MNTPAPTHGPGRAQTLLRINSVWTRARGVLASPSGQSAARLRKSARTLLALLPRTAANVDERKDAARTIFFHT